MTWARRAAVRRYDHLCPVADNNEADALILAAIGARLLGEPIDDPLPKTHLAALDALPTIGDTK